MNILFITADQWRGECLSSRDHPQVKTPNLDALAKEGVLFKNHYAQATPCAPSRTSLHTGMYLQNHRCVVNGTPLDSRFTNWALEANRLGYHPSLFGYTDTAADPRGLDPQDPRLTHYSEPLSGMGYYTPIQGEVPVDWTNYLVSRNHPMPESLWDLYAITREGIDYADGGESVLPLAMSSEDHETHYMVNRCIDWIKGRREPWITHLSLLRPHPPFAAPEPYNEMYHTDDLDEPMRSENPDIESQQHPLLDYFLNHSKYRAGSSRQIKQDKANYFGLMSEVDDNLGRLFDILKSEGLWDDTMIIFTSDHGEQLGDHWLRFKQGYFDQSYFIPLIIRDPRAEADGSRGKQFDAFTENVDIMPTMLNWLGLPVPSQCDGFSLLPMIYHDKVPDGWREEVHWECDFRDVRDDTIEKHLGLTLHQCGLSVIRDHRYKYIHFSALPPLFFDLQNDPGEFINLANDPAYQTEVLHYSQKMLSWKMNYQDRGMSDIMLGEGGPFRRESPLQRIEPLRV
ncbi:MAG: arylsulfatase A-like enzyme [Gammaproteobacteria bacterium]|jgi:arylsulfatase A-like enzyme